MHFSPRYKRYFSLARIAAVLACAISLASSSVAALANAWHIPFKAEVTAGNAPNHTSGGPFQMRSPYVEIGPATLITFFQGYFKGDGSNQTGGKLWYRASTAASFQSVNLNFHSNVDPSTATHKQFWYAQLNSSAFAATDVIQYYFEVTSSNRDTTFLYGGDLDPGLGNQLVSDIRANAEASPYSIRNRPAWIFHANNRVINGNAVQFWAKVGYQTELNNSATRWATNGALYYTTDGSEPAGSLGVPQGTTQAAPIVFDHPENLNQGTPNPTGTAMWWATESLSMPPATLIKYRLGFWHSANQEEKFADHNAGTAQTFQFSIGNVGDPVLNVTSPNGTLNGNYTTSKLFVDEIAGTSIPLIVSFQPGQPAVQVEVVTNLNQRDFANTDKNNNGEPDGIEFNQDDTIIGSGADYYYRSYSMISDGLGGYSITIPAEKTGAYRLTARWKVTANAPWSWFTYQPSNRRDHAITVSPIGARSINLYEINTLTVEAKATGSFIDRSTFEDLFDAPNAPRTVEGRGFNLDYLTNLGINWLWFQPVHPPAIEGRETDPATNADYNPGSPYAVKNFFQINPWMSANYNPETPGMGDITSPSSRDAGMESFKAFVSASDTKSVGIMLDAPFNHTGKDIEFDEEGVALFQRQGDNMPFGGYTKIRDYDTRFFSRTNDYAQRATLTSGQGPAPAPDRGDFGKWNDTIDVYFGRYDALVNTNPADNSSYLNEGDRFFYAAPGSGTANNPENGNWTSVDFYQGAGNTLPRNTTRQTWKYFARYGTYWLEKTRAPGTNRNSTPSDGSYAQRLAWDNRGIDGLRCDFGQGLPPQAWEYMINRARSYKWNFVMMSESLDGGAVTYRSNRHFDILNENIVFPLKSAGNTPDYRSIFDGRRAAYGQGLVLLNNTSHDEENYTDIWAALMRYNVVNSVDGAPMIFMGQELGVNRTSGFTFYETNFGKQVAHFKKFNSMQPGWLKRLPVGQGGGGSAFGEEFIWDAFSAVGQARRSSPALRSSNRWYLNRKSDNQPRNEIWAVGKYETPGASPNVSDVVLAFSNLRTDAGPSDTFDLNVSSGANNLFGIKAGRSYNVKNIAAYTKISPNRRDQWVWQTNRTGESLLNSGLFVALNTLPGSSAGWNTDPYEAQYLKLYDVTASPAPAAPASNGSLYGYVIGNTVTFNWSPAPDPDGGVSGYYLQIGTTPGGFDLFNGMISGTSRSVTVPEGTTVYARVQQINNAGIYGTYSTSSSAVLTLSATGDYDGDGEPNEAELEAATNALDPQSVLRILHIVSTEPASQTITWTSVPGKNYIVEAATELTAPPGTSLGFVDISGTILATGSSTSYIATPAGTKKFYRVRLIDE